MKAICKRKCFYQGRLYKEGEALLLADDAEMPAHFSAEGEASRTPVESEPATFYEIQQAEKAESERKLAEVRKALEVRRTASAKAGGKKQSSDGMDILN